MGCGSFVLGNLGSIAFVTKAQVKVRCVREIFSGFLMLFDCP
jgi:hypothetical protein